MKNYSLRSFIVLVMLVMNSCNATYVVGTPPSQPLHERPVSPGADYIWVDGDWVVKDNNYVWKEGYWARPEKNRHWQPGHWVTKKKGSYWKPGRWE